MLTVAWWINKYKLGEQQCETYNILSVSNVKWILHYLNWNFILPTTFADFNEIKYFCIGNVIRHES